MLGKLCPYCLGKYVHNPCGREVCRSKQLSVMPINTRQSFILMTFSLDIQKDIVYNYQDSREDGNDPTPFTPTHAPSAGLDRARRRPPPPRDRDRSLVPRQPLLRSERSGSGEVRDAAQCPGRKASGGGGCRDLWVVPPGVLRHSRAVPARRFAGPVAAQAWTEAAAQAQRRDARCAGASRTRGRTDAQGRGVSRAFITALWSAGTPPHHPSPSASLSQAAGKKP